MTFWICSFYSLFIQIIPHFDYSTPPLAQACSLCPIQNSLPVLPVPFVAPVLPVPPVPQFKIQIPPAGASLQLVPNS